MNQRKYKVLLLASWYPNRITPYNGDFVRNYALLLSKKHTLASLHVHPDDAISGTYEVEERTDEGMPTVVVYFKNSSKIPVLHWFINLFRYLRAHLLGYRIIEKNMGKPDLVHLQVIWRAGFFALYLWLFKRIPYIITEHWTGYMLGNFQFKRPDIRFFSFWVARNAKAITTVSEGLKNAMQDNGIRSEYFVVPNVVAIPEKLPQKSKSDKVIKRMVHVSSLRDHQKNVSSIIKVLKKISGVRSDWEMHLIGEGDEKPIMIDLVKQLGLEDKVIFHDQLPNDKVIEFVTGCDFMVMFSNYETFSIVTAEALCCGIPVVATVCGAPEEYVTPEMGIMIEAGNEEQLQLAIMEMLDSSSNFDRDRIYSLAKAKFAPERILQSFTEVYQSAVS